MLHKDGDPFAEAAFDADDHACVDFRFCAHPKMRWWFDHHATAFQPAALEQVFAAAPAAQRATWVFDASAPSCTGLLARELERGWAWRPPAALAELVAWADVIDAAAFPSAEAANALEHPAQQVAAWLAHGRSAEQTSAYVQALTKYSLRDVAASAAMQGDIREIVEGRAALRDAIVACAEVMGRVVVFDRLATLGARSAGFLGYELFPHSAYAISATQNHAAIKISVGENPWARVTGNAAVHLGNLCATLGGGGHAAVGGITYRVDEMARARAAIAELVRVLA